MTERHGSVQIGQVRFRSLVVVDEQSRGRIPERACLLDFVESQRGGDRVGGTAVQVELVVHGRAMTTKIDGSWEPARDRSRGTVFPVERACAVPTGAEMPFHLGTPRFYITFRILKRILRRIPRRGPMMRFTKV